MRLLISRKHDFHIFWFFSFFMLGNQFFHQNFQKIRKGSSISPVAWDSGKTKLLSRYFRPKTWKSVNSSIFIKFHNFHHFMILVEKLIFLILAARHVTFTHFGWRNVDTESRNQPGAGNRWNWAYCNEKSTFYINSLKTRKTLQIGNNMNFTPFPPRAEIGSNSSAFTR